MLVQLRFHGFRYRLGLATSSKLRRTADSALNAGLYSPSLLDTALDAEERLEEIGAAFEKALSELLIVLPINPATKDLICGWASASLNSHQARVLSEVETRFP